MTSDRLNRQKWRSLRFVKSKIYKNHLKLQLFIMKIKRGNRLDLGG